MKIFIFMYEKVSLGNPEYPDDAVYIALCEDGRVVASHLSSSVSWAQHDMGLTSNRKHEKYAEACPDNYELEWIDDPTERSDVMAAVEKNRLQVRP